MGAGDGGADVDTVTPCRGSQLQQVRLVLDKAEQQLLSRVLLDYGFWTCNLLNLLPWLLSPLDLDGQCLGDEGTEVQSVTIQNENRFEIHKH